jgi:hypothetical protein
MQSVFVLIYVTHYMLSAVSMTSFFLMRPQLLTRFASLS